MNEIDNAPSATSRLKRFGILNATKKLSSDADAPKTAAIIISRTKPSTLLARVLSATIPVDRAIDVFMQAVIFCSDLAATTFFIHCMGFIGMMMFFRNLTEANLLTDWIL
jgi:hypothetical protein